jgi:hypothetical protein
MKNRNIQFKPTLGLLIPVLLGCFELSPMVQAQGPDTEGAIPGENNGEGIGVLLSTTGSRNTGTGHQALNHNTFGSQNTATGFRALFSNTSGDFNTATGAVSLANNTVGDGNTANGYAALFSNTEGDRNTAIGFQALNRNTTGFSNTANGADALNRNSTGNSNTANGYAALYANTDGSFNTANGAYALNRNSTGDSNTAIGVSALFSNTVGNDNTAIGDAALGNNTSGNNNVALGVSAGSLLTTGHGNVCIGQGVVGIAGESNTTRIRNVYSSQASGRAVYVNSDNKIGTLSSSRRYKEEITPMDKASETLFALKPVTFRYKKEVDAERALSFGLIAEDVAKVSPQLITRDEKGNPQTVRYEAVNAMLLNEFLKQHRKVEKLEATVAKQHKDFEAALADLKEQIQKVSAQLELSKSTPQTVLNNQ